jgi:nucleotide-binding universal stress UspA family protein
MARRNRPGLEELILGSTTRRVLRMLQVPVLVVPEARPGGEAAVGVQLVDSDVPRYRHLLVATDMTDVSRQGLRAGVALADALDAKISLVHVVRVPTLFPLVAGEQPIGLPRGSLDALERRHVTSLGKEARAVASPRVHPLVVMGGSPGDALVETAVEEGADLIAIPAVDREALRRVLLGSTAERVARKSSLPVFVMPTAWLAQYPL